MLLDLPLRTTQPNYRCGQCEQAILDDEPMDVCPRCHTILCVYCHAEAHEIPAGDRAGMPCRYFPDDWVPVDAAVIPVALAGVTDLDWQLEPDERAF